MVCIDCPVVRELLPMIQRQVITYGFSEDADYQARNVVQQGMKTHFDLVRRVPIVSEPTSIRIELTIPGKHNILNAMAAFAVASDEGIPDQVIADGLAAFDGVGRRFQIAGTLPVNNGEVTLVDDYGHHPTEVMATVQAVRDGWDQKRLVMIFQPHRYSRTHDLYDDFVDVLSKVDVLLLLDVYAAGETPIAGADSAALCQSICERGQVDPILVADINNLEHILTDVLNDGDLLITQGAGDVGALANQLLSSKLFAKL